MDIADFPALKTLTQSQMDNLRSTWEERRLTAGEDLIHRGEKGGEIYFLLEGELEVYIPQGGREVELARLRAPAVVGELELLTGMPRTASVRAHTDAELVAIPQEKVEARVDDGDTAVLKMMLVISRMTARRLVALTEKFIEIEASSGSARSDELRAFRTKLFSEWTFDQSP
jgi:CRP/FNR family transcriptional regulator/CRP/FNR family cyclic AMP-dependent transcriptional regulator